MESLVNSDEAISPVSPQQPSTGAMASSHSLGRIVLISLGVLGLGLAIAFVGYYLTSR